MKQALHSILVFCLIFCLWGFIPAAWAETSSCEECHVKITPMQVKDFNRGKMSETMTCKFCHGVAHNTNDDAEKAELPTIKTCRACHAKQVEQYLSGKHAKGLMALHAMPYTHRQPQAFIEGQKGCGGCHTMGLTDEAARQTEERKYYRYGMDCQNCHTRHSFSKKEAAQPEACMTCHMGFDHAQWEMWFGSKHGVIYNINRAVDKANQDRAPSCQNCHMPSGDHRVLSAWVFLAVRLPEEDQEWMGYRTTILKGLGVLDPEGKPTARLDVVKSADMARLTKENFQSERKRYTDICARCHSPNFISENMMNADLMVKEADKLFAEAIEIVASLYQDGSIEKKPGQASYPDLLAFYDVQTKIEEILYNMFMDHRMKTFQGAFHMNYDYSTWYGYAKMKQDLVEIKELSKEMRAQ